MLARGPDFEQDAVLPVQSADAAQDQPGEVVGAAASSAGELGVWSTAPCQGVCQHAASYKHHACQTAAPA